MIADWRTYSVADFVPFTAEVYVRLIERANTAQWPLHLLGLAAGAAALVLARRGRGRLGSALLAGAWAWVGAAFLMRGYAELSWAGRPWLQAETFATHPDPTAAAKDPPGGTNGVAGRRRDRHRRAPAHPRRWESDPPCAAFDRPCQPIRGWCVVSRCGTTTSNGDPDMTIIKLLTASTLATLLAAPAFATHPESDRGDRIEERFDRKGDRLEERFDRRGDRIDRRFDRKGEGLDRRFDRAGARAEQAGRDGLARRLDAKGDRLEARFDRKGDRLDRRFDRKGEQLDRRFDRRGERIDRRLDRRRHRRQ